MVKRKCEKNYLNCSDKNNNCPCLGQDKEIVQCVGYWARYKYDYLKRYLIATRNVRKKFDKNTVFIDLFSGPGKAVVRYKNDNELESSSLISTSLEDYRFGSVLAIIPDTRIQSARDDTTALCALSPTDRVPKKEANSGLML